MSLLTVTTRRRTARGLLLLLLGLWGFVAAAPCVMAAPTCHEMGAPCPHMDSADCDTLQSVDCQTHDDTYLVSADSTPQFTALPPRLFLQPRAAWLPPVQTVVLQPERFALRLSPPPLYLQHTILLI